MSYDIDVYTKKVHYNGNYTSNVGNMYHEAYKVAQKREEDEYNKGNIRWKDLFWDDFKDALNCDRKTALLALKWMIEDLKDNSEKYRAMNPSNGWGDYNGALLFLEETYEALIKNENAEVHMDA